MPEQVRRACEDDLDAIADGTLTAHGLHLIAETLSACLPPDPERRRNEVIAMLKQHPDITHAFAIDADADNVLLTVGIRGFATCELKIPKAKYDGLAVLELIEARIAKQESL